MAGLGVVAAAPPPSPTPITISDVSAPETYTFDGVNYRWWRFTAPSDGRYSWDIGLSTLDGAANDLEPYGGILLEPFSGSATVVGNNLQYEDSARTWSYADMTAGSEIDIGAVVVSSLSDLLDDTLRPTTLVLRSNGYDSVESLPWVEPSVIGTTVDSGTGSLTIPSGALPTDWLLIGARTDADAETPTLSVNPLSESAEYFSAPYSDGVNYWGGHTSFIGLVNDSLDPDTITVDYAGGSGNAALAVVRMGSAIPAEFGAGWVWRKLDGTTVGFNSGFDVDGIHSIEPDPTAFSETDTYEQVGLTVLISTPENVWSPSMVIDTPGTYTEVFDNGHATGRVQMYFWREGKFRHSRVLPSAPEGHLWQMTGAIPVPDVLLHPGALAGRLKVKVLDVSGPDAWKFATPFPGENGGEGILKVLTEDGWSAAN